MRIGVPTEIKSNEFRVGLVPGSVRELTARGHEVIVQSGAGAGIFADDADYERAGARIVPTAEAVFAEAEMIVKVKEPQAVEYRRLKPHQILFTYLHLAPDPEQARGLMDSGATAIAYETVTDANGGLPLLAPMSEVAGRLAIEAAAIALRRPTGGRGVLMGGVPGVRPAKVVVLGGGVVGTHAARMAAGLGAEVSPKDFRKDLIIETYNEAGQLAIAYKVFRCWVPEFQSLADLDANANAVLIQHIKLENEGWERDYEVTEPTEPTFTEPA